MKFLKIEIKKQGEQRLKHGYPLIHQEDLRYPESAAESWVDFVSATGTFLGKGYLGQQNKGAGWVLTQQPEPLDEKFFVNLFLKAKKVRGKFINDELTTAFRAVNGEGDGIGGLTIDLYNEYAVFSWYNGTIYQKAEIIVRAFQKAFPEIKGASEKLRFVSDLPESRWVYGEQPKEPLMVLENGVRYAVYLDDGLMTGIFLDQKVVRDQLIQGLAVGKTVLNLFSYTGAFSVAAAMGGAAATTSVDLAKRSRARTEEQFLVNGLSLEGQTIVVMDTFEYFKYAKRKGLTYDLIILDPPSFARNKKKTFSVAKNYGELVRDALEILAPQGQLIASTNAANVALPRFREMVEAEFGKADRRFKLEQVYRLPEDFATLPAFPEGNYLKVLQYQMEK